MNKYQIPISQTQLGFSISQITSLILRDIEKTSEFNITIMEIENFRQKHEDLLTSEFDELYKRTQLVATEKKDALIVDLKDQMRHLHQWVQISFNKRDPELKKFRLGNISSMPDIKVLQSAKNLLIVIREHKTKLLQSGMKEGLIIEFESLYVEAEDALQKQITAKQKRNIATLKRKEAAYELFEQLQRYSKIGKLIWRNNSARCKEYDLPKRKTKTEKTVEEEASILELPKN